MLRRKKMEKYNVLAHVAPTHHMPLHRNLINCSHSHFCCIANWLTTCGELHLNPLHFLFIAKPLTHSNHCGDLRPATRRYRKVLQQCKKKCLAIPGCITNSIITSFLKAFQFEVRNPGKDLAFSSHLWMDFYNGGFLALLQCVYMFDNQTHHM